MSIDYMLYLIDVFLRNIFYRWTKDDFGLKEALFWPKDIPLFLRYSRVLRELKNEISSNKISVLEIGPSSVGISYFLKYADLKEKCDLTLADIDVEALSKIKSEKTVAIHGDSLPFEDNAFDMVISLDTLEHIPKDKRQKFLAEIKRIAKKTILLHFAANDPPKQFLARDVDQKFQEWHIKKFHKPDKWTDEHLTIDPPVIQEINNAFPGALITGTENIDAWFEYTTLCLKPLAGFSTGFMYMTKWKKKDNCPPFHSCFVKWIKSN
jgi:SAM-dependent methyltransferase